MNYDLIRNFVTVAKTQNITRAADAQFVSQSTVSHRLQLLEDSLGHPLVYRGRGKRIASLTEHGRTFLPIAEKWLALWQETEVFRSEAPRQHLRVGCVSSLSTCLISRFLAGFSVEHPNIHLTLQVLSSEEIYERMNKGLFDVGIVLSHLPLQNLQIRPLLSEKMLCVCSPHLFPGKTRIDPALLEPAQEVLLNWGTGFQLWHDFRFSSSNVPRIETNDIQFIEQALPVYDVWSIVPQTVADRFEKKGLCRKLQLKNPPPDRISYVVTPNPPAPEAADLIRLFQNDLDSFIAAFGSGSGLKD